MSDQTAYELPEKLKNLTPYAPLEGLFNIRLDANESFLSPPPELLSEFAKAICSIDFNRYPDPYCTELCEAFAGFFSVAPSHVVAGNGSDELIGLIVNWFTNPGDVMITVSPDFSMYAFYAQPCGVRHIALDKDAFSLELDADRLIQTARENNARLVMFSNPCNPTSLCASQDAVRRVVEALPGCLVVVDEAYMDFAEGSLLSKTGTYRNMIVLKTFSKAFGMAAIRLGFAVAHPTLAIALKAAKSPYNVNTMTQAVGCVLLSHPDYIKSCIEDIKRSRDDLHSRLCTLAAAKDDILGVWNTQANFVLLRLSDARETAGRMAARGVAVRNLGDYLRVSAGGPPENRAVIRLLDEILH